MDCSQFLNVVCQDLLVARKSENVAIKTDFYGYAALYCKQMPANTLEAWCFCFLFIVPRRRAHPLNVNSLGIGVSLECNKPLDIYCSLDHESIYLRIFNERSPIGIPAIPDIVTAKE